MVVGSVRVGGLGLWNSFKLACILITLWGIGGYLWFEPEININNACTTSLQCWYWSMDAGFRGDMVTRYSHRDPNHNPFILRHLSR